MNQGSLIQCYLVNKDSLLESILKENNRSCVIPTGYLFCCNDVHISFIVQRNTQNNRYFMLTCENEQFHLLGPFSLNALVKRVSEIYRQDDCINDQRRGEGCKRLTISMQSRVPLGSGKFHVVVLVMLELLLDVGNYSMDVYRQVDK